MKKNSPTVGFVIVGILLLAGAFLLIGDGKSPAVATVANPETLSGIQTGTSTEWTTAIPTLKPRLAAIGLPALTEEGNVLHIHQHLDIFVDGQHVTIPPGVGINEADRFISTLHVHDTTNVIHVESPSLQDFTLGQFFDTWGVLFTKDTLGAYKADAVTMLKVFVNGVEYSGDPRQLVLEAHQEIVVAYGTTAELPNPIPVSYDFPDGE